MLRLSMWIALLYVCVQVHAQAESLFTIGQRQQKDSAVPEQVMHTSAEKAALTTTEWGQAATLKAAFASSSRLRAAWDFNKKIDLYKSAGISFRVRFPSRMGVAFCTVYFKSGRGWYAADFVPKNVDEWEEVKIRKWQTRVEGKVEGWRNISAVRIGVWRAGQGNVTFEIADFQRLAARNPQLLVVRYVDTDQRKAGELRYAMKHTRILCKLLKAYGFDPLMVEAGEVNEELLKNVKCCLYPYYLGGEKKSVRHALKRFVENDGKLMSFYGLPVEIQQLTGIKLKGYLGPDKLGQQVKGMWFPARARRQFLPGVPRFVPIDVTGIKHLVQTSTEARRVGHWLLQNGDGFDVPALVLTSNVACFSYLLNNQTPAQGGKMLLSVLARMIPNVWKHAAEYKYDHLGQTVEGEGGYVDMVNTLRRTAVKNRNSSLLKYIEKASEFRAFASKALQNQLWLKALRFAELVEGQLRQAYIQIDRSKPSKIVAAWCDSPTGADGKDWKQTMTFLAKQGVNTLFVRFLSAGGACFPSNVVADTPGYAGESDHLRQCLAAADQHSIDIHVWVDVFRLGDSPNLVTARMFQQQGRLARELDGSPIPGWLAPGISENRNYMLRAIKDLVERYPVKGIHLDFIRYPSSKAGFSEQARTDFAKHVGRELSWPENNIREWSMFEEWQQFRLQRVTEFVESVNYTLEDVRKDCQLSAAVFPQPFLAAQNVGQDWLSWSKMGLLDFVCPMNYSDSIAEFRLLLQQQLAYLQAAPTKVLPIIGSSVYSLTPVQVIKQIEAIYDFRLPGFGLFKLDQWNLGLVLPSIRSALQP